MLGLKSYNFFSKTIGCRSAKEGEYIESKTKGDFPQNTVNDKV